MRMIDRIAMLVAAVILVAVGLIAALSALGWQPSPLTSTAAFLVDRRIELGVGALVLLLLAWYLVAQSVSDAEAGSIVRDTSLGAVHIQFRALENLVTRTAQEVKGVRDVESTIRPHGEGVGVSVSFNVLPEVKIPELSDSVQERVERVIREMAGLLVTDVSIEVRNVVGQPKARVE